MIDDKEKVSALLLEFEMNGATERQKGVLSKAIDLLIDEAARKRDALEINKLQRMQKRLDEIKLNRSVNFFDYLKALFTEGQSIAFAIFDIIGIVIFSYLQ